MGIGRDVYMEQLIGGANGVALRFKRGDPPLGGPWMSPMPPQSLWWPSIAPCDPCPPAPGGVLRWLRSFSSRRHFARRFENHTCFGERKRKQRERERICGWFIWRYRPPFRKNRNTLSFSSPESSPPEVQFWLPNVLWQKHQDSASFRIHSQDCQFDHLWSLSDFSEVFASVLT